MVIERSRVLKVLADTCTGIRAQQGPTGGWYLAGPLAPTNSARQPGRRRVEMKVLEKRAVYALRVLMHWEPGGDDHYRTTKRIQAAVRQTKGDLPSLEALLIQQLELEGCVIHDEQET